MEKRMRQRLARDLMTGLLRKGWILSHHATDVTNDLDEIIEENESLQDTIRDAAKHQREIAARNSVKKFGRYSSVEECLK